VITDLRREAMAWMLRQAGATLKQIGSGLGISRERTRQLVARYERELQERQHALSNEDDEFLRRLRLEGAIPPKRDPRREFFIEWCSVNYRDIMSLLDRELPTELALRALAELGLPPNGVFSVVER